MFSPRLELFRKKALNAFRCLMLFFFNCQSIFFTSRVLMHWWYIQPSPPLTESIFRWVIAEEVDDLYHSSLSILPRTHFFKFSKWELKLFRYLMNIKPFFHINHANYSSKSKYFKLIYGTLQDRYERYL